MSRDLLRKLVEGGLTYAEAEARLREEGYCCDELWRLGVCYCEDRESL